MSWTVRMLAEALGISYEGDGDCVLRRVDALESAGADSLSFVSRAVYLDRLEASGAGAVILPP
ncbi:MAG: LpxD N-terminal domain-containing protein, partial [Halofilum sp. (in: g-proteobacteria)]